MIKNIKTKEYQSFYNQNLNIFTTFLQSPQWGKFQEDLGYFPIYLGVFKNNQLQAIALVIKIKAKRGSFLFIPHGPIIVKSETDNVKRIKSLLLQLLNFLIPLAKKEKFDFIRIAPILENTPENQKIFQELGFKTAPIYMHAETTWVLALEKTEDELLSQMRKTARYLIRKAKRDEVIIEKRTDEKAIDDFYQIYLETVKREKFTPFSYDYIKKEFFAFKENDSALFFFAKIKSEIKRSNFYLASALILFNKNTAFYHQGASIHTKIPSTYLLQWEAIKEAKNRGCKYYNFWGIYDENSNRTPKSWQGLTLFKTGFGGKIVRYLPTQDYIISKKYYFTYLWEKFLSWQRRV